MNSSILIGKSRIDIELAGNSFGMSKEGLLPWIQSAAESVAAYYGRFPLAEPLIRVVPFEGHGVRNGRTFGEGGGRIIIRVGTETTPAEFQSDWMLTHEMIHLTFPSMAPAHHWMEEGLATYIEPIARVRANHFDAAKMWAEVARDLPQGLPGPADQGLDHTHTWGRTYWGGALFCFLADVEIHKRTKNKKGLEDALRAILDSGGDIREDWDIEKTLKTGDRAVGVAVLLPLYDRMKDSPYDVDLPALWKQLGVTREREVCLFDNRAPLAATLRAITYGTPSPTARGHKASATSAVFAGRTPRKSSSPPQ